MFLWLTEVLQEVTTGHCYLKKHEAWLGLEGKIKQKILKTDGMLN